MIPDCAELGGFSQVSRKDLKLCLGGTLGLARKNIGAWCLPLLANTGTVSVTGSQHRTRLCLYFVLCLTLPVGA